jgi:hypothetical protein
MISPYGFMYCFEKKTRGDFPIVRVVRYTVNDRQDDIGDCCNSEVPQRS